MKVTRAIIDNVKWIQKIKVMTSAYPWEPSKNILDGKRLYES